MESIVKIPALQSSFSTGAGANGLVDIEIPQGIGLVDLSRSAVIVKLQCNVNPDLTDAFTSAQGGPGVLNAFVDIHDDRAMTAEFASQKAPFSPAVLVRNASMYAGNKGKIEEVREVQCLRGVLSQYLRNYEDVNGLKGKGPDVGNKVTYPSENLNDLVGDGSQKSRSALEMGYRIPLNEIFDSCNHPAYDTSVGVTKIHLELHLDRAFVGAMSINNDQNGAGQIGTGFQGRFAHNRTARQGFTQNRMSDLEVSTVANQRDNTTGQPVEVAPSAGGFVVTVASYPDLRTCPFYVGQQVTHAINIEDTGAGGNAASVRANRTIASIEKSGNTDQLRITLNGTGPLLPNNRQDQKNRTPGAQGQFFELSPNGTSILAPFTALAGGTGAELTVNAIEGQFVIDPQAERVPNFSFVEYKSEEDSYSVAQNQSLVRNYEIPPNCRSVYIMFDPTERDSRQPQLESYRVAIDNVDILGRRVNVKSALDLDLKNSTLTNSGLRVRNLEEKVLGVYASRSRNQTDAGTDFVTVMFPCPLKANSQRLTLDLRPSNGGRLGAAADGVGRHIIYYECLSSY